MPKNPHMSAEKFLSSLKKRSAWWSSIMDPVTGGGARIPDPSGYHTACYQYVKRVTVAVNAQGVAGLRITDPYSWASTAFGTAGEPCNFQTTIPTSAAANLAWGDGTTSGNGIYFQELNSTLANGVSSLASLIRPVSGAVIATYTGTSLSDAGTFVSYTNPAGLESSATADSRFRTLYGATVMPVKANRCSISRLLPVQRSPPVGSGGVLLNNAIDYRAFKQANRGITSDQTSYSFREFGVYATGCTASTGSVEFIIVVNYEFVPRFNTGNFIEATASPQDPIEENFVVSNLSEEDATGTLSLREFAEVPSSSGPTKAERDSVGGPLSFMTEVVGFLGPILEIGLPLLALL